MTDAAVRAAAEAIRAAHETGTPCPPVREGLPEGDLDPAYAAQNQLGVDRPDNGMLFGEPKG